MRQPSPGRSRRGKSLASSALPEAVRHPRAPGSARPDRRRAARGAAGRERCDGGTRARAAAPASTAGALVRQSAAWDESGGPSAHAVRHGVRHGGAERRAAGDAAWRAAVGAAARRGAAAALGAGGDGAPAGDRCRCGRGRLWRWGGCWGARLGCAGGWRGWRQEGQRVVVVVAGSGVADSEVEVRRGRRADAGGARRRRCARPSTRARRRARRARRGGGTRCRSRRRCGCRS